LTVTRRTGTITRQVGTFVIEESPGMTDKKQCMPLIDIEDVMAILNRISIFAGFSEKQLYSIFRLLEKVSYSAGEKIFEQGEEPSHMYIVQSGRVKLVVSRDNTNLELIVFETGCLFGEASIIGIQPHGATLLSIYQTDLELFGILILNIAREVCRRLHASDQTLLHYVLKK